MNRYIRATFCLLLIVAAFSLNVDSAGVASASGTGIVTGPLTRVALGQSVTTSFIVNPKANKPEEDYKIVVKVSNKLISQGRTHPQPPKGAPMDSECYSTATSYGPRGEIHWTWETGVGYNANGYVVYEDLVDSNPFAYYPGWAYDHQDSPYVSGSGSSIMTVTHRGYFAYYGIIERVWGQNNFTIYADGTCTFYPNFGGW